MFFRLIRPRDLFAQAVRMESPGMKKQKSEQTNVQLTRRECLATTVAAGSLLLPASLAYGAHAAGSGEIKVALIGCGGRGSGAAAQALAVGPHVKLWAMADAFSDRLESSLKAISVGRAGQYGVEKGDGFGEGVDVPVERRFVGLDAYRKAVDSGADVIIITGPPGFRPQHFEYAINAGKHVFMEKPLATDATGIRRILAAAKKAKQKNLKVGVGLQRHHQASYLEAIRRIHDGQIGRIVTMRCFWNGGPPAKSPFLRGNLGELEYQIRNWYFFDWLSGDHICEQHIHNLDICNWAKGEHPISAEGMGGRQVRIGKEYGNIFDHHAVIYTYADGTKMHSYCRQMPGCKNDVAEQIEGVNGLAELSAGKSSIVSGGKTIWKTPRRDKNFSSPYQVEWNNLIGAIEKDKPHNEAEYGAHSTMTAILGRLATYSGRLVKWDDAIKSQISLTTDAETWDSPAPIQALEDGSYAIAVPGITKVL